MKLVEEQEHGDTKSLDARIAELESDPALQPHLVRIGKAAETATAFAKAKSVPSSKNYSTAATAMFEANEEAFKPIADKDLLRRARYLFDLKVDRQRKQPRS
jgi:hypothetical protein